jgi:hypothetical protein
LHPDQFGGTGDDDGKGSRMDAHAEGTVSALTLMGLESLVLLATPTVWLYDLGVGYGIRADLDATDEDWAAVCDLLPAGTEFPSFDCWDLNEHDELVIFLPDQRVRHLKAVV